MAKKVWTAAARAAFARKMKAARTAKAAGRFIARKSTGYKYLIRPRRKNPTKAEVKAAAGKIARAAGKLAWRGAKLTGRVGKASAKAAAAEVKASICRVRAKNPKRIRARVRQRIRRKNPFRVVIRAVPRGEYRKRAKNPTTPLYYDGRNFSGVKSRRKYFASVAPAAVVARQLLHRYPVLKKGYVVTLNSA